MRWLAYGKQLLEQRLSSALQFPPLLLVSWSHSPASKLPPADIAQLVAWTKAVHLMVHARVLAHLATLGHSHTQLSVF